MRRHRAGHRLGFDAVVDRIKVATFMGQTVRMFYGRRFTAAHFGTVSIVGVYVGCSTRFRWDPQSIAASHSDGTDSRAALFAPFVGANRKGEIDPSFVITHRATLEEGPELYKIFRAKEDGCVKSL